ncbi:MAG: PAS domain S-box protein [Syntrophobacteraceae bacterium]
MGSEAAETVKTDYRLSTGNRARMPDLEFFRACFSRFPDPVIVADMQSKVLFLNDSAQTLTGIKSTDDASRPIFSDILRNAQNEQLSLVDECLNRGTLNEIRVDVRNYAGDWLSYLLSAQLTNDSQNEPMGCVFILRPGPSVATGLKDMVQDHIFTSVIEHFPMPFFTVDTNLTITYMNDHLEKLTGYCSSEVVNRMRCSEVLRSSYCNTNDCLLKQAMEKRTSIAGVRRIVHDREGREVPVAVHSSMITDSENRVIGGFKALRDISQLIEAEQKIRMLVEITQEGVLMADEDDRIIFANSKMAEILDHPKDKLVGKEIGGLLPFQLLSMTRDLAQKVDQEHYQEVRFCSTIQPAATSHQEERVFETCIVVARFGKSLLKCLYFQDLTKHIQIERELFSANSFLNNIIMSSADGIVVADLKANVLIYNDSAKRILGYSADEVIGVPGSLYTLIGPELAKENMRRMRSSESGPVGKLISTRMTQVTKDGERVPVSFSAAIIKKSGHEIGTVGIFSDLRERERMRRELEEARMQLMQAEKIASIGRLAAGVAHEINNPLSGILIFAEILMKDLISHNVQWSEDLQEIINQTMRCKEIVARLLDFSRQSVGQKLNYDINTIIKSSTELLSHQALFYNIEFAIDLQADIPLMTGDPGQLQQVFINFIINAGTAMDGKGKMSITSRFDPASEQVVLHFADTGPGIPADILSKVFEPFFTTKGPGEGTGLGLSVAYGIIQQHGGTIFAANSPSGGAVFTVVMPLECPEKTIEFIC